MFWTLWDPMGTNQIRVIWRKKDKRFLLDDEFSKTKKDFLKILVYCIEMKFYLISSSDISLSFERLFFATAAWYSNGNIRHWWGKSVSDKEKLRKSSLLDGMGVKLVKKCWVWSGQFLSSKLLNSAKIFFWAPIVFSQQRISANKNVARSLLWSFYVFRNDFKNIPRVFSGWKWNRMSSLKKLRLNLIDLEVCLCTGLPNLGLLTLEVTNSTFKVDWTQCLLKSESKVHLKVLDYKSYTRVLICYCLFMCYLCHTLH